MSSSTCPYESQILLLSRIFTLLLMMYRVRGAILIGIILTSIISWPRSTPVTFFPHTAAGDAMFSYFKQVVTFHKLEKVGNAIEVSTARFLLIVGCQSSFLQYNYRNPKVWYALVTFLYVDILGMSSFSTDGI